MGLSQSRVDTSHIFDIERVERIKKIQNPESKVDIVCVKTTSIFDDQEIEEYFKFFYGELSTLSDIDEVYPQNETDDNFIRQGEIVGVIIHEPTMNYTKLCWNTKYIYDKNELQIVPKICSKWSFGFDAQEVINSDLILGLDVLYITHDEIFYFKEQQEPEPVNIFVPGLDSSKPYLNSYKSYIQFLRSSNKI